MKLLKKDQDIKLYDIILASIVCLCAYFLFIHVDLWETTMHSYVFLETLFSGKIRDFYTIVAQHNNTYYYINNANYNVAIYIIFGLWELPVFLFNRIAGIAVNENFLVMWSKAVPVIFYIGCGYAVKKLCLKLDMSDKKANAAAFFFLFNPVAFFAPMVMGQYDTLCLFFLLLSLLFYLDKKYTLFSIIIGIGAVLKFFPLIVFLPLMLLAEKRILKLLQYGVTSLWLFIPTSLFYHNRMGNSNAFTMQMINRLFKLNVEMGIRGTPVFPLLYALVLFACFMYGGCQKNEKMYKYMSVYVPMACFGILFNSITWHPQWIVLLIPFITISTFMQKDGNHAWFYLDIVFCYGFFFHSYYMFANQMCSTLFDTGILGMLFGIGGKVVNRMCMDYFLSFIPFVYVMTPVAFSGAIIANILFKFPYVTNGMPVSIGDRLFTGEGYDAIPMKAMLYAVFTIGFIFMWVFPTVLEMLYALGLIGF